MNLRDYQLWAVEELRAGIRAGHRAQVLCAPTGSGKTVIATFLMQEASNKLTQAAFIVDRVALIDQTSRMFDQYGIDHGVMQAQHWRSRPWERIQVCSSQTLSRRGFPGELKLIVVDECHTLYKSTVDFIKKNPEVIVLGLSATPFTRGLGKIYSNVVNCTTTFQLVNAGYLAPVKAYAAKRIDMTGAKLKFDGEWQDSEIEQRGMAIIGDVVQGWIQKTRHHFGGPVKTILFSATVAHGEELCRQFQAEGFNFQQVSYKDGNDDSRRELIDEFRKPDSEVVGLVSCEALAKGFDVPDVKCGISCRPYRKSLSGHIQTLGRVMRPADGKEYALWLDHGGNYLRFAADTHAFFSHGVSDLSDEERDNRVRKDQEGEAEAASYECRQCHFIMEPTDFTCPACGWSRPKRRNLVQHEPGQLAMFDLKQRNRPEWMADKASVWRQIVGTAKARFPADQVRARKWALAQYRNLYDEWPGRNFENVVPELCSEPLGRKLRSLSIAYWKGKGRQENRA